MPVNSIERLASTAPTANDIVPEFRLPPMPERVLKVFPELREWEKQFKAAHEDWRVKLNITIRGGQ